MAYYNPYQNQYMAQMQMAQPVQVQQPQLNNGLIWVQGEMGAKSYLVAPNTTVLLMDSENQRFYLKSSDASGMPLPLRVFEYTEKAQNTPKMASEEKTMDLSSYATKAEIEPILAEIEALKKKIGVKKSESAVSGTKSE